jgi:hypothetical protein
MMTEAQTMTELASARGKLAEQKEILEQANAAAQIATIKVQQLSGIVIALSAVIGVPADEPKPTTPEWAWFSTLTDVSRAARRRVGKLRAA